MMKKSPIFSISGLRGIVGKTLYPEMALKYATAFGVLCNRGKVILARDSRKSGEVLRRSTISGLLSIGCDVMDLGICPTPTLTLATENLKADGGICITASHNPVDWNGMKFVGKDGTFLSKKQMKKLNLLAQKGDISDKKRVSGKLCLRKSWHKNHIDQVLKLRYIKNNRIKKAKLRVVIDCNNGAGGKIAPLLLRKMGCEVIELNCSSSGEFAHPPEPTRENLSSLAKLVKRERADIGFCLDPDGDRLGLVTDGGIPLSEEYTLALATQFVLSKHPKPIAINLSTSNITQDIAENLNCRVCRTPVGEYNVAKKLKSIKGIIGGEGNGGIILPELHYTRDALVGMALILEYLTESNQKLSQLIKNMPRYFMIKKRVKRTSDFDDKLKKLIKKFKKKKTNKTDGIRIDFKDSWLHIRKSNTEPIIRIIAEAKTKMGAEKLVGIGTKMLS